MSFRWLRSAFCRHEWTDGYIFASIYVVTIPTGERRPTTWRMMRFCDKCGSSHRRLLTLDEYETHLASLQQDQPS